YAQGAITAGDLVRSLERDVVVLIPGCDLEDAVAAALEATPDKRKRDLLSKASEGRAIGPGGATRRLGASRGGRSDVTVEGRRGQQYLMSQGGERISSGKSSIFNGVERCFKFLQVRSAATVGKCLAGFSFLPPFSASTPVVIPWHPFPPST
ncbi:unnamed protein product, partial [Ectocarpus sp. 12 AP-2014]